MKKPFNRIDRTQKVLNIAWTSAVVGIFSTLVCMALDIEPERAIPWLAFCLIVAAGALIGSVITYNLTDGHDSAGGEE